MVTGPADAAAAPGGTPPQTRWARLRHQWDERLQPGEQATVLAWASFTLTFAGLRGLTHWIRAGHGPSGGGISMGGRHFHHYNIGIGMLATVAGVGLRGTDKQRRHPAAAVAYGAANAMIVDELALLLDLKDVYWASDGRESVDVAVGVIATGATVVAGMPFWPHAHRALRSHTTSSARL
ncbi:hypothetical protein [Mycobacterium mantenii]|uniref:hypothetical protein n=1 Tax=Mycobacterium mantenii TaxID=560555 RepID=UPI001A95B3C0|nr:hypothetical protein [Mycobacterium mantenii]